MMHKIMVGLSGGVDSSVSALLLLEQGYAVEGLFMKNWEEDDNEEYCAAAQDLHDAQQVCAKLGIPCHSINFAAEYWDHVFAHFLAEYQAGRTPNPDILCNKEIKFKAFLHYAQNQGYDGIAMGHYVRKQQVADHYQLLKGIDPNKDQSYFLYTLNQTQLHNSLFPVGQLTKPEVRALAKKIGFDNANKKDSTGICFIGERKFKDFLSRYLPAKPGLIQTTAGETLGTHEGLMYYTIGQRQGLKIGGTKNRPELPWYVAAKNLIDNTLIVVQEHNHPLLLKQTVQCNQIHWIAKAPEHPFTASAKVRYRTQEAACSVQALDDQHYEVTFAQPQWAVTPGQSIVFYQNDQCLGGGIII
jgi:tRNA-uridine 2-sulfurtransferase